MEAVQIAPKRGFQSFYTKGEEIFNAVSHIVGGAFGLVAWIVLALLSKNAVDLLAVSVFAFSVIVLYTMSALYHFLPSGRAKGVFRVFDHCTIFLLIAGTYTPYCLIPLYATPMGNAVLIAQWTLAAAGITMNAIAMNNKFVKGVSMVLYVVMGWMAVVFIAAILPIVTPACFALLFGGGVAYTAGILFFALGKKVKYFHAVWHLFVILGTVLQFVSILLML